MRCALAGIAITLLAQTRAGDPDAAGLRPGPDLREFGRSVSRELASGIQARACINGLRAVLAARAGPPPDAAEIWVMLHAQESALVEVCPPTHLDAALAAHREERSLASCRLSHATEVSCDRLIREIALYRRGD